MLIASSSATERPREAFDSYLLLRREIFGLVNHTSSLILTVLYEFRGWPSGCHALLLAMAMCEHLHSSSYPPLAAPRCCCGV